MEILFLNAGCDLAGAAREAWEQISALPLRCVTVSSPEELDDVPLSQVACVVGIYASEAPDGLPELVRDVRTRKGGPDVPIVVFDTSEGTRRGLRWALAFGADDYVSVSEPIARLVRRVETFSGVAREAPPPERGMERSEIAQALGLENRSGASVAEQLGKELASTTERRGATQQEASDAVCECAATIRRVATNVLAVENLRFAPPQPPPAAAGVFTVRESEAPASTPALAPAQAPAPSTAAVNAPASTRASAPGSPAPVPSREKAEWLRARLKDVRERDYFTILGVDRDASDDAVRDAYDRAARACDEAAAELGKALEGPLAEVRAGLAEAFDVLRDPSLRVAYGAALES